MQATAAAAAPAKAKEAKKEEVEELDPTAYHENRIAAMAALEASGVTPYPHKFHTTTSIPDFVTAYGGCEAGAHLAEVVSVAGRVHFMRSSSSKLQFYDLRADGAKVQVMMNFEVREEGAEGRAGRARGGALCLRATFVFECACARWRLCLHALSVLCCCVV